jgi:hypothetical protein
MTGHPQGKLLGQGLELVDDEPVELLAGDVVGNGWTVVRLLDLGAFGGRKLVTSPPTGRAARTR